MTIWSLMHQSHCYTSAFKELELFHTQSDLRNTNSNVYIFYKICYPGHVVIFWIGIFIPDCHNKALACNIKHTHLNEENWFIFCGNIVLPWTENHDWTLDQQFCHGSWFCYSQLGSRTSHFDHEGRQRHRDPDFFSQQVALHKSIIFFGIFQ